MATLFKEKRSEIRALKDMDMLLIIEKGIRGGICHSIHRHVKANNKYMKEYDKNNEPEYIIYINENNLYDMPCFKN